MLPVFCSEQVSVLTQKYNHALFPTVLNLVFEIFFRCQGSVVPSILFSSHAQVLPPSLAMSSGALTGSSLDVG